MSPARTGVSAANRVSAQAIVANRHMMHGSGVAIGDVDGDGLPDLYVARLSEPNVLYRNEGRWRFSDVTEEAGVALSRVLSTGAALVDIDGDADLDLLVTMLKGPGAVLLNDGTGRFTDATAESGLSSSYSGTTLAAADVDGDHDLDLYVARYKRIAIADSLPAPAITWEQVMLDTTYAVRPEFANHFEFQQRGSNMLRLELAEPDGLYLNDGQGRFEQVSWTGGAFLDAEGDPLTAPPKDWALTARFYDVNADGHVDLYVCNDFESSDALWLGRGNGTFQLAAPEVLRKTSNATMSVDFADIDRDGHVDMFLTDMLSVDHARRQRQRNTRIPIPIAIGDLQSRPQEMQNTLFVGRGDGTFAEIANLAGVAASDWSWSTSFLDVDLDGFEDILITTGHVFDVQDLDAQAAEQRALRSVTSHQAARSLLLRFPDLQLPNVAFRNNGDRTFEQVAEGWGLGYTADVAHGMALGDLDQDGDQDVVISRLNEAVGLYRNTGSEERLAVQLRGPAPNTHGVGASIAAHCPGLPVQERSLTAGGQYQSWGQMQVAFAASGGACQLTVRWADGTTTEVSEAHAGRLYEVRYTGGGTAPPRPKAEPRTFALMEALPSHVELPYDDFARQPLLPRRLSQRGPALAVDDLNGDGYPDLVAGSGRGGRIAAYVGGEAEGLSPFAESAPVPGDVAGLVTLHSTRGTRVVASMGSYEQAPGTTSESSHVAVYRVSANGTLDEDQRLPFGASEPGPLAAADLDGDDDLDLFVGGSFHGGAYPAPASSRIYRQMDGRLEFDGERSTPFENLGLVTGAALGDLDADGDADVVVAEDWGPVRVWLNEDDTFIEWTESLGLSAFTGWWNGVALGDFDTDGRLDIVATNWGWNLPTGPQATVRLYYGDVDANGTLDLFEGYRNAPEEPFWPTRQLNDWLQAVPGLVRRFPSHAAFASMPLESALADFGTALSAVEATTFGSSVFLNRGTHFEAHALPQEAQFTVATGVVVTDVDADGHEDLILAQNWFALPLATPRQDAGRGLWLRGDGGGGFEPVAISGLEAYGEGRALVTADFDQDGRNDVAIAQNGAPTLVYRNQRERSGLTVRLEGPPGNPRGIGATVRLRYADGTMGPVRLVAAGSGYWSQNSAAIILGRAATPSAIEVQWPDAQTTAMPLGAGVNHVQVQHPQLR